MRDIDKNQKDKQQKTDKERLMSLAKGLATLIGEMDQQKEEKIIRKS